MEKLGSKEISQLPLCGVCAVANVANVGVVDAFYDFKKKLKKSHQWKGRTKYSCRSKMLKHYKIKHKALNDVPRVTLSKFVEWYTVKGKAYIVTTTSHTQVVKDGMVTDQRGTFPIAEYWGKSKRLYVGSEKAILIA